ncbi:unnamed protein product [Ophioblennius macclurei]
MNSPYTAMQHYPDFPFLRLRDPSSCLSWRDGPFRSMVQSQSPQASDFFSQEVFNQLFDILNQSSPHSMQPIQLDFSDRPADGSAGNTIQISMDCLSVHEPRDVFSVSKAH